VATAYRVRSWLRPAWPAARAQTSDVGPADEAALAERSWALFVVRVGLVGLAFAAVAANHGAAARPLVLPSLAYLGLCLSGQLLDCLWRRSRRARGARPGRLGLFQGALLPADSLYLGLAAVASGAAEGDFIWLFAVQLVSATLLGGARTGARLALGDSAALAAMSLPSLGGPVGEALGAPFIGHLPLEALAVSIAGFWALVACTAWPSALSERELRRSRSQLEELTKMAEAMEEASRLGGGPGQIGAIALRSLVAAFGFQRVALRWVRAGRVMTVQASSEGGVRAASEVPVSEDLLSLPFASPLEKRAQGELEPLLARRLHVGADPLVEALLPRASNVVLAPLRAGPGREGLLVADLGASPGRLGSRRSLGVLGRFAAHLALALSNADRREEVSHDASSDGLTGLANRRTLLATLRKELSRASRSKRPLSVVLFDVDHFKQLNDTYGHLAGDEVLREVAKAMEAAVREIDLVARYGGEEFALVLPECDATGAATVAERVRGTVARLTTVPKVTLSAGVATTSVGLASEDELLGAADEALYSSKLSGRDRVTVAPPPLLGGAAAPPSGLSLSSSSRWSR
jgi:diguanylate cyclase (GGDEF)-like protein